MTKETAVTPIMLAELDAIGQFLAANMNARIAPEQWKQSLVHPWCLDRPNFGMKLTHQGQLVGTFLAIYSDQRIRGQVERICNAHTWCVLPAYRSHALSLAVALVRQPGYHFSVLTPNANVTAVFRFLKFKELDNRVSMFPNVPSLARATFVDDGARILARLSTSDRTDFENHSSIPWLQHGVVVDSSDSYSWFVFKQRHWRGVPGAEIIHVSDSGTFNRCLSAVRNYLLFRKGMSWTRIDTRLVGAHPRFSYKTFRSQPKMFMSTSLREGDITDLYSELASLDI